MKYYAEVLDNIIINLGTYEGELPEGMYDIEKTVYDTADCGETLFIKEEQNNE